MKKKTICTMIVTLMLTSLPVSMLAGCGGSNDAPENAESVITFDASEPEDAGESDDAVSPVEAAEEAAEVTTETAGSTQSTRKDGERFEGVIMLEGTEETVKYEHAVNNAMGFEIDYEYESLKRNSEPDKERFVSIYDDPENPVNYLEVTSSSENADTAAKAVEDELSKDYDIDKEQLSLDHAGSCIRIDASAAKGGGTADKMQTVFIIPSGSGSIIARSHYNIESAEGFGRSFDYMVNTLSVIGGTGDNKISDGKISDEQALSAIKNYCLKNNPDLESVMNSQDAPVYWDISSSDDKEIVVLFRSYTGALVRYYIDRGSGATYVTEYVEGITPEEERTDESFNVRDYLSE